MEHTSIGAFFGELLEDDIQREIVRLVSENLEPEQILRRLLGLDEGASD